MANDTKTVPPIDRVTIQISRTPEGYECHWGEKRKGSVVDPRCFDAPKRTISDCLTELAANFYGQGN